MILNILLSLLFLILSHSFVRINAKFRSGSTKFILDAKTSKFQWRIQKIHKKSRIKDEFRKEKYFKFDTVKSWNSL